MKNVYSVENNLAYREKVKIQFTYPNHHVGIAKGVAIAAKKKQKILRNLILNNLRLLNNLGREVIKFTFRPRKYQNFFNFRWRKIKKIGYSKIY